MNKYVWWIVALLLAGCTGQTDMAGPADPAAPDSDPLARIQARAVRTGHSPYLHWGADPDTYAAYDGHSNRLVPVYVRGPVDLGAWTGTNSVYRDAAAVRELYGYRPAHTVNESAVYMDQTNVYDIQRAALDAGVDHIFLVVFDGMGYAQLRLAMLVESGRWTAAGGGDVFSFQEPDEAWQFGFAVTSPYTTSVVYDVDAQTIEPRPPSGGYNAERGGATPWARGDSRYLMGRDGHAVTDSAASATAMNAGRKTYNGAINVGPQGQALVPVARLAQQRGYAVGAVTSVPFNHATPAAAYANNVNRHDYQDIARDMLGLPSVSHPNDPLPGMDVVLGAGFGIKREAAAQGANYVPGNVYIAAEDRAAIRVDNGGRYVVAQRTPGKRGREVLQAAVARAVEANRRLFGLFGTRYAHLPFATADGDYRPVANASGHAEHYTRADVRENPTLAQMTDAALTVLADRGERFWLMVESGDVDWAAHANNVDNAVGAIVSGNRAVRRIIEWVEAHSNWRESLLIVTADHGHMLHVDKPRALAERLAGSHAAPGKP